MILFVNVFAGELVVCCRALRKVFGETIRRVGSFHQPIRI